MAEVKNVIENRGPRPKKAPHVCIVGAGISGLKCSETLLRNRAKVTIYEARDRTGGRVCQSEKLGHLIDLGPSWIHGGKQNPFFKLAEQTDSALYDPGDLKSIFDCNGRYLDKESADQQTNEVWSILEEGFEFSEKHSKDIPAGQSLADYVQQVVQDRVNSGTYTPEVGRNILDHMRMWGAMIGTEIERQSFKFFWLERVIDGESSFLASTYKNILALITKMALAGADLHLSTEVTGIHWNSTNSAEIRLANRTTSSFDEVVVTAPLGSLKRNKHIFGPLLPPDLAAAIDNIGYGQLERAWKYPAETLFPRPTYTPTTNPNQWNQELLSLSALPSPFSHPTLRFSLFGALSKSLTARIHDLDPNSKEYYDALDAFFRPYYSKLPRYDASRRECKPIAFECSMWQHDEWAGWGSYSNFQVGSAHADRDIERLREGMGVDRGVWFAGEAVAPVDVLGTVTGAYVSGEIVAERILGLYGATNEETRRSRRVDVALYSGGELL